MQRVVLMQQVLEGFKRIQDAIGDGPKAMMDDLYRVSRALTDARANVSTTGKANQWLEMMPRGVMARVAQSKVTQEALKKGVDNPSIIIACADYLALNQKWEHAAEFLKATGRSAIDRGKNCGK